jgi:hypothetical protein
MNQSASQVLPSRATSTPQSLSALPDNYWHNITQLMSRCCAAGRINLQRHRLILFGSLSNRGLVRSELLVKSVLI